MTALLGNWRNLLALGIVLALAVVDSVSWVLSFCADLVLAGLLFAVLTVGRNREKVREE